MSTQRKRSKTQIENMGLYDFDIFEPTHSELSLRLLDPKLIKKILWKKVFADYPKEDKLDDEFSILKWKNSKTGKIFYRSEEYTPTLYEILVEDLGNIQKYVSYEVYIRRLEMGHVVVKRGYNGFSQRLGFVDVFCSSAMEATEYVKINGKKCTIDITHEPHIIFFQIKTSPTSVSVIAREIEFYRDALAEIENVKVTPFFVGEENIPVSQFDTITFDEISQMEKIYHDI